MSVGTIGRQTFGTVLGAETRRRLRSRRTRATLLVAGVLALASAVAVLLIARTGSEAMPAGTALPLALELAAGTVGLLLSLHVLSSVTGETVDGTVLGALLLVPDRRRLLLARALVWPGLAAGLLALIAPGVYLLGLATGLPGPVGTGWFLLGAGIACLAVGLVTTLAFLAATALRRGAMAMGLAIGFLLVLPLAVGVAQVAGPESLQPVLGVVLEVLPGVAVMKALGVSVVAEQGWSTVVGGLLVLIAWVAVTGPAAVARFAREGTEAG